MPANVFEIVARVKDQATRPLRRITERFKSFGKTVLAFPMRALRAIFSPGGILLGGLAALLSFRGLGRLIDDLDELGKTADRVNATAESLSALKFAGELSALSFQQLSTGVSQFSRNLENARRGAALQLGAFNALGLDPNILGQSGELDLVDVFSQVADGLNNIGSASQRNDVLLTIFGRSGANLGPLFAQGAAGIREMADEAERLGFVFSRAALSRAERFNDAWTRLSTVFRGALSEAFIKIEPLLTKVLDAVREWVTGTDVASAFENAMLGIAGAIDLVAAALDRVIGLLGVAGSAFDAQSNFSDQFSSTQSLEEELFGIRRDRALRRPGGDASGREEFLERLISARNRAAGQRGQLLGVDGAGNGVYDDLQTNLRERLEAFFQRTRLRPDPAGRSRNQVPEEAATAWQRFFSGWQKQAAEYIETARNISEQGRKAFAGVASALEDGLTTGIAAIGEGFGRIIADGKSLADVWKNLGDVFKDVGKDILQAVNDIIARMIAMRLVATAAGFLGFGPQSNPQPGNANFVGPLPAGDGFGSAGFIGPPVAGARASGGSSSSGGDSIVININAIDTRTGAQFLLENSEAIAAAVSAQLGTNNGFRLEVRGGGAIG